MNLWNRFMVSLRAGYNAWNESTFMPVDDDWDSYANRLARYQTGLEFYNNKQYDTIDNAVRRRLKEKKKLYRHTKGIVNPTYRAVEGYASSVYPGEINKTLRSAGFYVETDDDKLRDYIWQVLHWSNWMENKALYVRSGSMYGDVFLKVIDDTARQKAYIEVLDPRKVKEIELDATGNITAVTIEYIRIDAATDERESYTYKEVITKESFSTFKNGSLHAYNDDGIAEWDNIYGFVPMRIVNHVDMGQISGAMAIHSQIDKIHYANDQASVIADSIRNAIQPLYHAKGVQKGNLGTNRDEPNKDEVRVVYTSADSELVPLTPDIDIDGATANLERNVDDIEADIPILALHKIRDGSNITAPGVIAGFSDAIHQVQSVMANYDSGTIKSVQMCMTIAGMRGYGDIPFNENSFDNGDMEFSLRLREPIKNDLTKLDRVQILGSLDVNNPLTHLILEEMGYEADAIQDAERRAAAARQDELAIEAMRQRQLGLSQLQATGRQLRDGQQPEQPQLTDGTTDDRDAIIIE